MKIGLLTYHRSHNFGAMLQAYALKTYIKNTSNNEIAFIDYYPSYFHDDQLIDSATLRNLGIKGKIKYLLCSIVNLKKIKLRKKAYCHFFDTYLSPVSPVSESYDLAIYGSDQIWRYQNRDSYQGFSDVFWGDCSITAERKITFAASMGSIPEDNKSASYCKKALKNFDAISVREADLRDFLARISPSSKIEQHLDPVFLLNKEQWRLVQGRKRIEGKYILVYNLQDLEAVDKMALQLQHKTGLQIINLRASFNRLLTNKNEIYDAGPDDFVSLIREAEYVITSSFHGTAFSILLNVPFYCCSKVASARISSMLSALGLEERMSSELKNTSTDAIDWREVNEKIEEMVYSSKDYLKKYIK